jgi:peroxiredoxin
MNPTKIFLPAIFFLLSCSHEKDRATITGQLKNCMNQKIYFEKITSEGDIPLDSAVTDGNGSFKLRNSADELDYYLLRTENRSVAYLVLKGGENITVTGDASDLDHTYEVEGSEDTKLLLSLKRFDTHLTDSMNRIYSAVRSDNPFMKDSVGAVLQQGYDSLIRQFAVQMIRQNLSSLVSLSATQYLDKQKDFSLFEELNDSLKKALGDNRYVEVFSKQVADMKRLPVGSMAPEIKLPSPDGKIISLSSLKNKIVVIDFWASWCGPCRREMPEMASLYKDFKDRGLEIYGVSLDDNADAWKTAIEHDHIQWIQVSELKKWDSAVVAEYGIEEIPQKILLDREGKIIAKGLSMSALRIKIQELMMKS